MKTTINLINADKSDVKYELTTFPDGEPHIKLEDIDRKKEYVIVCRVTNPSELFVLAQVGHILKRQGVIFDVQITYLMSMRMDRVINFNEAFSLEIVASIINGFDADNVYIFEAHSDRVFKEIKNSAPYNPLTNNKDFLHFKNTDMYNSENGICFPDHGAQERYGFLMPRINKLCMKKVRDLDNKGVIKSMELENYIKKDIPIITIVDDLCDGGGTFCWAYAILKDKYPDARINIFVKHLVNPVGFKKLADTFDDVYITDSYKDWSQEAESYANVHIFKINE